MGGIFSKISVFLYYFFSPVCHQSDARSFHILGYKFAVCSRCMFIYLGFLFAVILYPVKYKLYNIELPSIWLLLIPAVLTGLDVFMDMFGFFSNSFFSRSITGFVIGAVLPFFLIPGFVKMFNEGSLFFKKNY
ncbi:MAG: DUF2085 domain-containing protein [Bacteroidetes bacterium]|nr:DUF2085 domain-containing protein [Bacteroidota bacterium]